MPARSQARAALIPTIANSGSGIGSGTSRRMSKGIELVRESTVAPAEASDVGQKKVAKRGLTGRRSVAITGAPAASQESSRGAAFEPLSIMRRGLRAPIAAQRHHAAFFLRTWPDFRVICTSEE